MPNLGFYIKKMIENNPTISEKVTEIKVKENWEKLFGNYFKGKVDDLKVKGKILIVKINSPSLKNDLQAKKDTLIKKLNQDIPIKRSINNIIFF